MDERKNHPGNVTKHHYVLPGRSTKLFDLLAGRYNPESHLIPQSSCTLSQPEITNTARLPSPSPSRPLKPRRYRTESLLQELRHRSEGRPISEPSTVSGFRPRCSASPDHIKSNSLVTAINDLPRPIVTSRCLLHPCRSPSAITRRRTA
jgi:hypothetical protein